MKVDPVPILDGAAPPDLVNWVWENGAVLTRKVTREELEREYADTSSESQP